MFLTRSEKIWRVAMYIIVAIVSFSTLLPIWHIMMQSISKPSQSSSSVLFLWPHGISLAAYKIVLKDRLIVSSFRNSVIVTVVGTLINLIMTFLAAYPLSRRDLRGRMVVQYMIFFTLLFSGGLIPTYLVVSSLKLSNKLWALMIPGALSAYYVFVLRAFISALPSSLQESAFIDGANDASVLMRIIIPLSKPVIAVLGILYGVWHWNSWFECIIYITNTSKYTLQPILRQIVMVESTSAHYIGVAEMYEEAMLPKSLQMAAVVVATLPMLCVYPFLQKYFVKGIMLGAIKG